RNQPVAPHPWNWPAIGQSRPWLQARRAIPAATEIFVAYGGNPVKAGGGGGGGGGKAKGGGGGKAKAGGAKAKAGGGGGKAKAKAAIAKGPGNYWVGVQPNYARYKHSGRR